MGNRLLVVDSDRRFIQEHRVTLESSFDVDFREGTEGSLAHLEGGGYRAVLICVEASENKGYSLCSAIRRSPQLADLKVALISAKATAEEYNRHKSLKGRAADLYLHKPIRPGALVSALTPLVPPKPEDPDNPLGDLGGTDLADEWLETLKNELEVEPQGQEPDPAEPAPGTSLAPVSVLLGLNRPLLPPAAPTPEPVARDAGRIELLESRIKDLETKLVAAAEQSEARGRELAELRARRQELQDQLVAAAGRDRELEDLRARHRELQEAGAARDRELQDLQARHREFQNAATARDREIEDRLDEEARRIQDLETRLAEAEQERDQQVLDLEELRQQAQDSAMELTEKGRLAMDALEANQLLQAQLAEAREQDERLTRSCEELTARSQELESSLQESLAARERQEDNLAALSRQLALKDQDHERQQLELMTAIDDRDARMARMDATLDAQREQIDQLEKAKAEAGEQVSLRANRLQQLQERLAELETQTRQALDLARTEVDKR